VSSLAPALFPFPRSSPFLSPVLLSLCALPRLAAATGHWSALFPPVPPFSFERYRAFPARIDWRGRKAAAFARTALLWLPGSATTVSLHHPKGRAATQRNIPFAKASWLAPRFIAASEAELSRLLLAPESASLWPTVSTLAHSRLRAYPSGGAPILPSSSLAPCPPVCALRRCPVHEQPYHTACEQPFVSLSRGEGGDYPVGCTSIVLILKLNEGVTSGLGCHCMAAKQ